MPGKIVYPLPSHVRNGREVFLRSLGMWKRRRRPAEWGNK
ncbi:hypothetical protein HMPREF3038_01083 [Akkermansia sp. KLE1797]|nr:hypothetical protein HMPREF3038_01083 [Akkermansia sp. KLE1797]KXU53264.1 hypothetical protein HMPREF3039_02446 [Akkermansia sp. KLE1798]KZA05199.1 hypothetical protein HMPREF1326_01235 [Akkermansia sp. KLE1605]